MPVRVLVAIAFLLIAAGCKPRVLPPADFKQPAVGTLMPGGHEEAIQPALPPGISGALVINQLGVRIQVAVSNTIATLPIGQDFLFSLPPGTYEFYIYEPDSTPRIHTEVLQDGKLRYLYLSPIGRPPGG
jgi:hypothetical protein